MKKISHIAMVLLFMTLIPTGIGHAADEKASLGTQATPQSLGGQAGEVARELKETAGEGLSTGATKVAESSRKVEAEVQETAKTLQQQWDVLAKQLQEKTQQIQKEFARQWQDFNQSLNKPPKS